VRCVRATLPDPLDCGMPQTTLAVLVPPFPVDALTTQRLHAVLQTDSPHVSEPHLELRETIIICTRQCRALGMSAEATILTVKALVRYTAHRNTDGAIGQSAYVADRLLNSIVTWSIAEYYRA